MIQESWQLPIHLVAMQDPPALNDSLFKTKPQADSIITDADFVIISIPSLPLGLTIQERVMQNRRSPPPHLM
jgi:hypothetical protein